MHNIYSKLISAVLLLSFAQLNAQSDADLEKINNPIQITGTENAARENTPGCDCANALPLANGEYQYLPTVNTFLQNIINAGTTGMTYPSCLGSAPNQTWYEFTVSDTGAATIVIAGQVDYDYLLIDATGFPCEEFNTFTGQYGMPQTLGCSYSTASTEVINALFFPEHRYLLIVTNYSNIPVPYTINVYSGINLLPFSSKVVRGMVYSDNNGNCIYDAGDAPISNAHIEYTGTILHAYSLFDGTYRLLLPGNAEGLVQVSQTTVPSLLWSANCVENPASFTVDVPEGDTLLADVPYSSTVDCAIPLVETSVPFLRRCFTSTRLVQYGNYGTLSLPAAEITLRYDEGIIPVDFSVPYTFDGTLYHFDIEPLSPGQTGNFWIVDSVSCENGLWSFGCVEAEYIQPPDCYEFPAEWDESDLAVHAECSDSTTATFTISNTGSGNMSQPMPYEVRRNGLLEDSGTLQLNAGAETTYSYTNDNDLVTFVVWETNANPFNTFAWALSDCHSALFFGGGAPGYAIQDQQPWLDIDCDYIIGAFDPNDKFAWPFGVGNTSRIERTDELEYRIRFQNTGSDTAFTVVLVDTLSEYLDIETLRFTGNSHPYTYTLEDRTLTVRFENILLPDSASSPQGSIGYIRFALEQVEDNPVDYVVENFADIYFDFNEAIRTNSAIRTVGETALSSGNNLNKQTLTIYPNPARNQVFISLQADAAKTGTLELFDMYGKLVRVSNIILNNPNRIELTGLSSGIYFVKINSDSGIQTGRFVVE
ncbi:MAG: T9SS type A sorting domain-containing protein [Bacteroidetes bacterium]|nr:T9SS type A sorting domain-containing protein [Bacteroidota bacterium]